jgi:hypothetical protein
MILAVCTQVPELSLGAWRDPEVCKKYPGSGWMPLLPQMTDLRVCSGDEAIALLLQHHVKAQDIRVVQEGLSKEAHTLIEAGAIPDVLFCLESPLYDPTFYDRLPDLRVLFPRQILFGAWGTERVYFPSFDAARDLKAIDPESWRLRPKRLAAVMANKHYSAYPRYPGSFHYQKALEYQLHDRRATILHELKDVLDLYGKGWNPPNEIPAGMKVECLSQYQYTLCLENLSMPGYLTEKIIDAIVAGSVPLYAGDPTIEQLVPSECFVGATGDFKNWHGFERRFEKEAPSVVYHGQRFLRSPEGYRFSYQAFAKQVLGKWGKGNEP